MNQTIPMCWKCDSAVTEECPAVDKESAVFIVSHTKGEAMRMVGCTKNPSIQSYSDAKIMCPALDENINIKVALALIYTVFSRNSKRTSPNE